MKRIFLLILTTIFTLNFDSLAQEKVDLFDLSFESLANIKIVSATKKSQNLSDAPAIISIITQRQIKDRGYQSVAEALKSVPGLYQLSDRLKNNLGIRGISGGMRAGSRIVKLMIDGQPVSYRPSTENFLGNELIPINIVERVEIVRGAASALYGSNAFLGVINIITKTSTEKKWGEISTTGSNSSNSNGVGTSILFGGSSENLSYKLAGVFYRNDQSGLSPINVPGSSIYSNSNNSFNDISRNGSLYANVNYENEKTGNMGIDFNYQLLDSYGEFQDWGVLTHNNRINIGNYFVRLKYSKEISDKLSGNLSIAYSNGEPKTNDRLDIDNNTNDWISREVGYKGLDVAGELSYNFSDKNYLSFGIDRTSDDHNLQTHFININGQAKSPLQGIENGNKTFLNTGYFLQAIYYPIPELGFTGDIRYDDHNIYEDVTNFKIASVYHFTDRIFGKILYGTSYKAPASVQLFSNYIVSEGVVGNPDLKPEKAKTLEAVFGISTENNINFTINSFYNVVNDKVELVLPSGAVANVKPDNIAKINSAGVEFEIQHGKNNFTNYVNYSYQKSIIEKNHLVRGTIKIDTDLFPNSMMKFGTNYRIPEKNINLNFEGRYIGSRNSSEVNSFIFDPVNFRTNRYKLESYLIVDAVISKINIKLNDNFNTDIMFKINNVFDKLYYYPGFKNFDIPGFERTFLFNLAFHY